MEYNLIIHGHFYQPPREDPWTEEIEEESSASPYSNWNERIHSECYQANGASRVLGAFGRIRSIVNNYKYLSFNFGPTLLSWMEKFDPETLATIVKADEESKIRNNGHGNAIAQVYNHVIMPLSDEKDRETEIIWGIEDFKKRFHRMPEAMWMSETAVDIPTLEQLIKHGMKFVILSPFQADEVQQADKKWQKVEYGRMDTSVPYWINTPSGKIAAFFYHPELSSDVSFNHLLKSSEAFTECLLNSFDKSKMVNIATDGEIYGHHEPFGDMCLSYTFAEHLTEESKKINKKIRITNYGAFLEKHKPQLEAKLRQGGSSWSCAHGVERWRNDCGCKIDHSKGWNQKWRAPLRQSLDIMRDSLRKIFESEGKKCFKDHWAARNAYIKVILSNYDSSVKKEFASEWFTSSDSEKCWRLLESQKNALLMYTSCGWFFDDISGIEPKQLMLYAARAHAALGKMANQTLLDRFVKKLKEAKSNIVDEGDGAKIFKTISVPRLKAKQRILNQTILANFAGVKPHPENRYRIRFEGEAFWNGEESSDKKNGSQLARGTAVVMDVRTESKTRYAWIGRFELIHPETIIFEVGESFRWPGGDPRGKIWEKIRPVAGERKGAVVMGLKDLFRIEAKHILKETMNIVEKDVTVLFRNAVDTLKPLLDISSVMGVKIEPHILTLLSVMSEYVWREQITDGRFYEAKVFEHKLEKLGVKITKEKIGKEMSARIDYMIKRIGSEGVHSKEFDALLSFIRGVQDNGIRVDSRRGQEWIYNLLKGEGHAMIGAILENRSEHYSNVLKLIEAAERLNIEISYERQLLEPFERKIADDPNVWP